MRMRRNKLSEEFLEAQARLISAAIDSSADVFMARLDDPALVGAEMRNFLLGFQVFVQSVALTRLIGHYPTPVESAQLLDSIASWRRPAMCYFDIKVARLLLKVDDAAESDIPNGRDHIEYAGRIMPTVTLITAYAFSHSSEEAKRWRSRLRETARAYEGRYGRMLSRGGMAVKR